MSAEQGSMDQLRNVLFATLDGLKAGTVDPNRAKAIAQVAQTLLNSIASQIEVRRLELQTKQPFLTGMPLVGSSKAGPTLPPPAAPKPLGESLLSQSADPPLSAAAKANRLRGL